MITRPTRRSPYLLILIVVAIVGGVVALAYNRQSSIIPSNTNSNATANVNTNTANINSTNTQASTEAQTLFQNDEFGFSLSYPASWKTEQNENGEGENRIVNFIFGNTDEGVTLIVLSDSMEGIVRESVSVVSETPVTINGAAATRISARSAKDGSPLGLLFFKKNATLYDLNGPADLVDSIGSTFQFTNP